MDTDWKKNWIELYIHYTYIYILYTYNYNVCTVHITIHKTTPLCIDGQRLAESWWKSNCRRDFWCLHPSPQHVINAKTPRNSKKQPKILNHQENTMGFSHEIWRFPVDFPFKEFHSSSARCTWKVLPSSASVSSQSMGTWRRIFGNHLVI